MNQDKYTITEADIQSYVDGELPAHREQQMLDYLRDNPEQARRVIAYKRQNSLLQQLYGEDSQLDDTEVTQHILPEKPGLSGFSYWQIAASVVLTIIGGATGWFAHVALQSPLTTTISSDIQHIPEYAVLAHAVYVPEVKHPVEVDATQQAHLLKWLSKRLGKKLSAPDLGKVGFSLLGGRLLPAKRGPAAQFMYQNNNGERLTLYIVTDQSTNKNTAFRYFKKNGINVFYWTDADLGFAIASEISQDVLSKAANSVYTQLGV